MNPELVDPSYRGTTLAATAGEDLVLGDVVYYNSDEKVYKAKADSTTTMICMGVVTADTDADATVTLLVGGLIRSSSVYSFATGGQASSGAAIVYVSDSVAGDVTQTRPTVSGYIVQIIGYAVTADLLSFKPDYTYIEIT